MSRIDSVVTVKAIYKESKRANVYTATVYYHSGCVRCFDFRSERSAHGCRLYGVTQLRAETL